MKRNVGPTDKLIRLILAFVLLFSVWFGWIPGTTAQVVVLILALIFALTSFLNYCPLYMLFGFNTNKTG